MENAINTIVTDQAIKQVDKLIEKLDIAEKKMDDSINAAMEFNKALSTPPKTSDALNKQLQESQRIIRQLQADYKAHDTALANLQKKYEQLAATKKTVSATDRQTIIDNREIRKELDGQAVANSTLTSYIQKLSVERASASRIVADYNAQLAMGTKLTDEQSVELVQATASFQKYDNAIKAGKKSIGDAREYVGQYERANWGLNNSVNQLTRELPALSINASTFFLAISNNIGPFQDAIKAIKKENEGLIAQGKGVTSVWSQLSSAFFSWNTLLSVGVTLLTVYGSKLFDAASQALGFSDSLSDANHQLDLVNNAMEDYNRIGVESTTVYEKQYAKLKQLIAVMKDTTKEELDRNSAKNEALSLYPGYFSKLTEEELTLDKLKNQTSNYNKALRQLTADLKLRAEAEAKQNKSQDTLKLAAELQQEVDIRKRANDKIIEDREKYGQKVESMGDDIAQAFGGSRELTEMEKNIKKRQELMNEDAKFVEKFGQIGIQESGSVNRLGLYTESQIVELEMQSSRLRDLAKEQQDEASNLIVQTSLLDVKDTKNKDDNTRALRLNTKAREDYLASEYALLHLRLTNIANANKAIMDDEASGYDLRLMASEQYYGNLIDLANMEAKEELRVLQFNYEEKQRITANEYFNEKERLEKQLENTKTTAADKLIIEKSLKDAKEQFENDKTEMVKDNVNKQNIIYENQAQKLIEANKELVGKMKKAWDEINFGKADLEIGKIDLSNVEELGKLMENIGKDMSIEEIKAGMNQIAKLAEKNNIDINEREAQLQLDRLNRAKQRLLTEIQVNGEINNLSQKQIDDQIYNNKALMEIDKQIIEGQKNVQKAKNETSKKTIEDLLIEKETYKKINDEILESRIRLFQELSSLGSQLLQSQVDKYDREIEKSNEYYDALLANAEKGSEQETLLQEEKERRAEEIRKKKIDAERRLAIFNKFMSVAQIGIDLAKTIAAINLAAQVYNGIVPGSGEAYRATQMPLAIAISGAQVASVLATPLPQYKDGRGKGKDEYAVVGDGGVREVIQRGNGRIEITPNVPTVTHLGKDDEVHKSLEDFQKSRLSIQNASIMASFASHNRKLEMFDYYLGKELRGISSTIEKGIEKGFSKAKINNHFKLPDMDIGHLQYKTKGLNS